MNGINGPSVDQIAIVAGSTVLGLLVVVGLPVVLGLRHAWRVRELEHAERMRALELGQKLPRDEPWWTPIKLCAAIGAGVPIGVFLLAFIATHVDVYSRPDIIWPAAMVIGITAVICGTILARRLPATSSRTTDGPNSIAKADSDPDALDVVSRRG